MKTSYFAKSGNDPNAVSIARFAPSFYQGKHCTTLAPSARLLADYKDHEIDADEYTIQFNKMLNGLDANKLYKQLGDDVVLLCWEGKSKFCHRHLVAAWFEEKLGIQVPELE